MQTHSLRYKVMTGSHKKLALKAVAAGVVVAASAAVWKSANVKPVIIICLLAAGCLIVLGLKLWARRKTRIIFGFYVASDGILVNDERRRYRFEIAEVIKTGERVVRMMPDPPALSRFALGALYHSIGDHNAAVEQLGFAAEEEVLKDSSHVSPSRQLRRYVERLRQIERAPKRSAKINAAMAGLERMHHERAARLLAESQQQLRRMVEAYDSEMSEQVASPPRGLTISNARSLKSITAPPPISEVLNDIYQEEPKAS